MTTWLDFISVRYISRVSVNEKTHRNLDNRPSDVYIDRVCTAMNELPGKTIFPLIIKSKNKSKDKSKDKHR